MIEVSGVQPTARELRAVTRGWGDLHWWALASLLTPFVGLWSLALIAIAAAPADEALARTVGMVLLATVLAAFLSRWLLDRATLRAARSAPGGGMLSDWHIGPDGLDFGTEVSKAYVSWAGIKAVREERDRFVFLLGPHSSPVLPKRQMSEPQITALRDLVAEVVAHGRLGRGVD